MSENYNFQPQQNPQDGYPQQGYQQPYPPTLDPEAIKAEKNAKNLFHYFPCSRCCRYWDFCHRFWDCCRSFLY